MKIFKIKTLLAIAILTLVLSSCKTEKESDVQQPKEMVSTSTFNYYSVSAVDYYISGMHYKVFNSAKGDVFVVNITNDSLSCLNKTKN